MKTKLRYPLGTRIFKKKGVVRGVRASQVEVYNRVKRGAAQYSRRRRGLEGGAANDRFTFLGKSS